MGRGWGHGDMAFTGHGSIRSPINNTNTPLGLDRGLGDMGARTWGLGDMVPLDHLSARPTRL